MTDETAAAASSKERALQPDRVYVGWQYARLHPDPGPPPRRPTPPEREQLSREWIANQRHDENVLNRPIKIAAAGAAIGAVLCLFAWFTDVLSGSYAVLGIIVATFVLAITGYAIWQGEQALRSRIDEEKGRIERAREKAMAELNAAHERHAAAYREWQRHRQAYESQKEWYPVSVPQGVDRVDVAGGTLSGWRAMVTMMGAARLESGSEITVLDLSEGAVAGDLVALARARGEEPLVWVLPSDLPKLDLSSMLDAEAMADVLSLVVSVSEKQGRPTRDVSFDNAILERVLTLFGGRATIAQITAALRALAQVGDPRDDIKLGLLDESQLEKITTMFGRGANDRVVIERAWALESQLRKLETLGTEPARLPRSRLKVVSMDRRAGVFTNRVLGTYVVTALTHLLRASPPQQPWGHTLFICGADKLRGDVLDRLVDACETTYTGLVLMYRAVPQHVKERLGRGNAAVGFMRLGNAEDARLASEHIGAGHRFEISRLTDGLGREVTDFKGSRYVSTLNPSDSPTGSAQPRLAAPAGQGTAPAQAASGELETLTEGIRKATDWGRSTSSALSESVLAGPEGPVDPAGQLASRELRVEPQQLQELPHTAMIFTHATTNGRRILLVDANPGIMTLPVKDAVHVRPEQGRAETGQAATPAVPSGQPPAEPPVASPAGSPAVRPAVLRPAAAPAPPGSTAAEPAARGIAAEESATERIVRGRPAASGPAASGPVASGTAAAGTRGATPAGRTPAVTGHAEGMLHAGTAGGAPGTGETVGTGGARPSRAAAWAAPAGEAPGRPGGPDPVGRDPAGRDSAARDPAGPDPGDPADGDRTVHGRSDEPAIPPWPGPRLRTGAALRTGTPPPLNLDRSAGVRPPRAPRPAPAPVARSAAAAEPRGRGPGGRAERPTGAAGGVAGATSVAESADTAERERPQPAPEVESFTRPGEEPPPNLGPPKERLDFRAKRDD